MSSSEMRSSGHAVMDVTVALRSNSMMQGNSSDLRQQLSIATRSIRDKIETSLSLCRSRRGLEFDGLESFTGIVSVSDAREPDSMSTSVV